MIDHARITRRHFMTSTLATSAALAAPAWAQAPAALRSVEQITVLQLDEVASLDPLADFTNPGLQMHAHILEPLIDFTGPDFKMTPKLALSWDNPTPTRWRFKLRPNVTWHDGTPFTAEDVKYTLETAKGPTSVKNRYLARVQKIDILDNPELCSLFAINARPPSRINNATQPKALRMMMVCSLGTGNARGVLPIS